jgi:hypothetical protein
MQFSGGREPNLRERLNCVSRGLSNRLRLSMDLFQALLTAQDRPADVYLTEQGAPADDRLLTRCRRVGSEFVDPEGPAVNSGQEPPLFAGEVEPPFLN